MREVIDHYSSLPADSPSARNRRVGRRKPLRGRSDKMPVIDYAREPLDKLLQRWRGQGMVFFLWLRFVRPLILLALWSMAVIYAVGQYSGLTNESKTRQSLLLCVVIVLGVLLATVVLTGLTNLTAPRIRRSKRGASIEDVSRYAGLSPTELTDWQSCNLLLVEHNTAGRLDVVRPVEPGQTQPGALEPLAGSSKGKAA